jgi:hypothetical protein
LSYLATSGSQSTHPLRPDGLGHEIYLTDERWQHIMDEHPEMEGCEDKLLDTLRFGKRFQDSVRPNVFPYHRDEADLPCGNTTMVVVVRFGALPDGTPNNFVLTGYQVFRLKGLQPWARPYSPTAWTTLPWWGFSQP